MNPTGTPTLGLPPVPTAMRCRSPHCVSEPAISRHPAALCAMMIVVPCVELVLEDMC